MGRPRKKAKTKGVFMRIDHDLYRKSKALIPDRTKDYEDYLKRKIVTSNRAELIKMEIDELDMKKEQLMKEYDYEIGLESFDNAMEEEMINKKTFALNTVLKIITNEGAIGLDRIDEIATVQGISAGELKTMIPEDQRCKVVQYHYRTVKERSNYDV